MRPTNDEIDNLVQTLRGFDQAYPESVFPKPTEAERKMMFVDHPGLQDRIAADMGRHCGKFFRKAADMLEALKAEEP